MMSYPPITELLPHRHPMLFLDEVCHFTSTTLTATCRICSDRWPEPGGMPAYTGIELIAQAIAAHNSLTAKIGDQSAGPSLGVLLGTRKYSSAVTHFGAEKSVTVSITEKMQDESGFGAFDGAILSDGDTLLASATIKVFRPSDFRTYLSENRPK